MSRLMYSSVPICATGHSQRAGVQVAGKICMRRTAGNQSRRSAINHIVAQLRVGQYSESCRWRSLVHPE
jgi:hypothetical protein